MKWPACMIALMVMVVLAPVLRAGELVTSAQVLFPIQDNSWQMIRLNLKRPELTSGTLVIQDARGGPRVSRQLDAGGTPQTSVLIALPMVALDEVQKQWPIRVQILYADRDFNEQIDIPITHETQPVYRMLVPREVQIDGESLRSVSRLTLRTAEIGIGELPYISGAEGIVLPRSMVRRSGDVPRNLLACGTDIWVQGLSPPGEPDSALKWLKASGGVENPDLTMWRLAAPAGALPVIDPAIAKLPFDRPAVPDVVRQLALWLPVVGVVLITAIWLMSRRAWLVWLMVAVIFVGGALTALILVQQSLRVKVQTLEYAQGRVSTKILGRHAFLNAAELIAGDVQVPHLYDLPAMPLAVSGQQWFGMSGITVPDDPGDEMRTTASLPARRQLVMYARSVQLPTLITAIKGDVLKSGVMEASGQPWETWLMSRPMAQQKAWRTWWLQGYRAENAYKLSASDWPVAWQMDAAPER